MNWLDLALIIALLGSTFAGFLQGFVRTLLSLIGVVAGVLIAGRFYAQLAGVFGFISSAAVANIVAYVVILLAVIVAAGLVGSVLRSILAAIKLGCADRVAGAILGLLLGTLFISAVLAGVIKFFGQSMVTDSAFARLFLDRAPLILGLLPSQFDTIRDLFR